MSLEKRLERLERKVDQLLKIAGSKKKPTWVKASVIAANTGWNKEKLRQARQYGYVEWKKEGGKFLYNLDSVHRLLLIKPPLLQKPDSQA